MRLLCYRCYWAARRCLAWALLLAFVALITPLLALDFALHVLSGAVSWAGDRVTDAFQAWGDVCATVAMGDPGQGYEGEVLD